MESLVYIGCGIFLVWIVLGLVLKTKQPFKEAMYRTGIKPRPLPPEPEYERFDLEI